MCEVVELSGLTVRLPLGTTTLLLHVIVSVTSLSCNKRYAKVIYTP